MQGGMHQRCELLTDGACSSPSTLTHAAGEQTLTPGALCCQLPPALPMCPTDQRFKRIVLRTSCMLDHLPAAYKMGLTDVLDSVSKKQQQAAAAK